ncbi:VOC family protein [Amnibacterium sp.]|uniref:VOC family protein n=1 Tax=Amnibacterium sp. TaxID=1872496 RepID=UPI002630F2B6|nr:VOC family protein [Amnibacterium sp.]MCU1472908.1 glyoxalase [Amnibacterium sp.]
MRNRSAPPFTVMPVLSYPDVSAATAWLQRAFGLVEHVRIGDHRAQLGFGEGALFVADTTNGRTAAGADLSHSVTVRVSDIDAHYRVAAAAGAQILAEPADQPYGERQYTAADPAGHRWTFTQSIADVAPEEWGGTTVVPW